MWGWIAKDSKRYDFIIGTKAYAALERGLR